MPVCGCGGDTGRIVHSGFPFFPLCFVVLHMRGVLLSFLACLMAERMNGLIHGGTSYDGWDIYKGRRKRVGFMYIFEAAFMMAKLRR